METRQAEWGTEGRHNWQLNGHILTSLTGHKGNCVCMCVRVELSEPRGKEVERESIWERVSQLAVEVNFRGFKIKVPPDHNSLSIAQSRHAKWLTCPYNTAPPPKPKFT